MAAHHNLGHKVYDDDMSTLTEIPYVVLRDDDEVGFLAVEIGGHSFYVTTLEWQRGCGHQFIEINGNRHIMTLVDPYDTELRFE